MFYAPKDLNIATLARHLPSTGITSETSAMAPVVKGRRRVRRRRRKKVFKIKKNIVEQINTWGKIGKTYIFSNYSLKKIPEEFGKGEEEKEEGEEEEEEEILNFSMSYCSSYVFY